MSKKVAEKIIYEYGTKGETYTDRFLRVNGIKKDRNGNPDIAGKVLGNYHNVLENINEARKKRPNCDICKQKIDFQEVYTTRQNKGEEIIKYYHNKCRLLEGTTSSST
jgi:hypothetical protein